MATNSNSQSKSNAESKSSALETASRLAVITGASSGIGLELAKLFAKDGYDLIVCSNSDAIEHVQSEIEQDESATNVNVMSIEADLATKEGVNALAEAIKSYAQPVDALVLNAGIGLGGSFIEQEKEEILKLINLNITGTAHLARELVPQMVERGQGRILFTSSIAAMMPGTYEAIYGASKAFIQSFAQALRKEIQDSGVTVTCLQPGPTETNFFHRAQMDDTKIGSSKKDHPADVALEGYNAMMKGDSYVVAGAFTNKVFSAAGKFLPETFGATAHVGMSKPGSGSGPAPEPRRKSIGALPVLGALSAVALGGAALYFAAKNKKATQLRFGSKSIIHSMPYLSLNIPK